VIALATGAELVGVTSLDALAEGLDGDVVASVLPAGKGEVFVQARRGRAGELLLAPTHVALADVAARLAAAAGGSRVVLAGAIAAALDGSALGERVTLALEPPHDLPTAAAVGRLGLARPPATEPLEPLYVRPPDITLPAGATAAGEGALGKSDIPEEKR
jgi:tRNA A37 threonylcarbamoyladenosine modification protein TsaB